MQRVDAPPLPSPLQCSGVRIVAVLPSPACFPLEQTRSPAAPSSVAMRLAALSKTQCGAVSAQAAAGRPGAAAAAPSRAGAAAAGAAVLQRRQRPAAGGGSGGRGRLVVTAAVKVQKGKQMLCSKTMKAKEGHEEQLRQLCQGVADFSRQRIADRGSGVLAFELSEVRLGRRGPCAGLLRAWACDVQGESCGR